MGRLEADCKIGDEGVARVADDVANSSPSLEEEEEEVVDLKEELRDLEAYVP